MQVIWEKGSSALIQGDNVEVLREKVGDSVVDSCISDFPYDLNFMGKAWDKYTSFYEWNKVRATELYRVLKPGGYVAIFGHPKTNHRMKCAFEDVGFNIVEEIEWVYLSGMPKNQDMAKMFEKQENVELMKTWDGWKTSGLKPTHEPITIFQKPLEGTYCDNVTKYACGCMNIDACRVAMTDEDRLMLEKKASKNPTTNYSDTNTKIYGKYAKDIATPPNEKGRFPSNLVLDEYTAILLDEQTGDGSKIFNIIKYVKKPTPSEKKIDEITRNTHVTVKPIELIEWLIKLLTPKGGYTVDITAGSCTHGVSCERLNREEQYNLRWLNIEQMNTDKEPYCTIGKVRLDIELGKEGKLCE